MSIESICNQALDLIGYKRHIGSIWDGTRAARIALDAWAETRDVLLHQTQPYWAVRDTNLTLAKTASSDYIAVPWNPAVHPDLPWLFEYSTPSDCIYPLQIKPRLVILPAWRPRAQSFKAHVNSTGVYVILSDQVDPILSYISRVLDPALWQEDFTELMVEALAKKFQSGLAGRPQQQPQQQERQDANAA